MSRSSRRWTRRSPERLVIVAYDIRDERRRGKASRVILDFGRRVQQSVFECRLSFRETERLRERLARTVEPGDQVLIQTLCETCSEGVLLDGQRSRPEAAFVVV